MDLVNPLVAAYISRYSTPLSAPAETAYRQTLVTHGHAHMMSDSVQLKFLEIFSISLRPSRVLEIGTFTGLSAMSLAAGLSAGGTLHTIELREADADTARANFERSNYGSQIILHTGNALQIIPNLKETWDLVFIDADKTAYLQYYQLILPFVRTGGVIVADNVLFHGQVLTEPVTGKNARAIQEFNDFVKADERVHEVMLPLRDGLLLIQKK